MQIKQQKGFGSSLLRCCQGLARIAPWCIVGLSALTGPGVASAEESATAADAIEEVIVTARKRQESLQET
ncbi:MAG: hypothetical protein F4184_11265, partial [Gemmatimonadetes bacterium]|nr:hypothetical protein [Gemmatimonadota bacterium]